MNVEKYISKLNNYEVHRKIHYNLAFTDYDTLIKTVNDLKDHVDVVEILDDQEEYNQGIYRVLITKSE